MDLDDYKRTIHDYMVKHSCSAKSAVDAFTYNLYGLKPIIDEFDSEINFRNLGQQWNALPSDDRIKQKDELIAKLSATMTV